MGRRAGSGRQRHIAGARGSQLSTKTGGQLQASGGIDGETDCRGSVRSRIKPAEGDAVGRGVGGGAGAKGNAGG